MFFNILLLPFFEIDRLETNRQEDLGNSINYIENELQLQRVLSQVEAYEKVLG